MKYKNFDDFFSSIDINKNEMIDNWENLKKRKKKITIITTIVMITIILSLFYLICYNTKLIRLIIPMFILSGGNFKYNKYVIYSIIVIM